MTEVYVLLEVLPYEGSEIIDIFITPEAAMADRPGRWEKVTNDECTYWTTAPRYSNAPYFLVNSYTLRAK